MAPQNSFPPKKGGGGGPIRKTFFVPHLVHLVLEALTAELSGSGKWLMIKKTGGHFLSGLGHSPKFLELFVYVFI